MMYCACVRVTYMYTYVAKDNMPGGGTQSLRELLVNSSVHMEATSDTSVTALSARYMHVHTVKLYVCTCMVH